MLSRVPDLLLQVLIFLCLWLGSVACVYAWDCICIDDARICVYELLKLYQRHIIFCVVNVCNSVGELVYVHVFILTFVQILLSTLREC